MRCGTQAPVAPLVCGMDHSFGDQEEEAMGSIGRRRLLAVLTALTMSILAPAASATASPAAGRSAKAKAGTKTKAGTKAKAGGEEEAKLEASIVLKLTPPEESLPITDQINLFVPEHFRDAGASLPYCNPSALRAKGVEGCPKGSIVGVGKATGYTILGGQFVIEHLSVTLINGPNAVLLSWVEGKTPVAIEEIVEGVITKPAGYGEEMAFTIPQGLLEPLPGAPGWLQTLEAHLSGKVGWLRTTSCPPHPWALKAELGYENGQGTTIEAKIGCE
jgi:hypothetical protein